MTRWDTWFRRLRDLVLLAAGLHWGNELMQATGPVEPLKAGIVLVCLGVPATSWLDGVWRRWAEHQLPPAPSTPNGAAPTEAAERAVP